VEKIRSASTPVNVYALQIHFAAQRDHAANWLCGSPFCSAPVSSSAEMLEAGLFITFSRNNELGCSDFGCSGNCALFEFRSWPTRETLNHEERDERCYDQNHRHC
jgi:hypothetical protein